MRLSSILLVLLALGIAGGIVAAAAYGPIWRSPQQHTARPAAHWGADWCKNHECRYCQYAGTPSPAHGGPGPASWHAGHQYCQHPPFRSVAVPARPSGWARPGPASWCGNHPCASSCCWQNCWYNNTGSTTATAAETVTGTVVEVRSPRSIVVETNAGTVTVVIPGMLVAPDGSLVSPASLLAGLKPGTLVAVTGYVKQTPWQGYSVIVAEKITVNGVTYTVEYRGPAWRA